MINIEVIINECWEYFKRPEIVTSIIIQRFLSDNKLHVSEDRLRQALTSKSIDEFVQICNFTDEDILLSNFKSKVTLFNRLSELKQSKNPEFEAYISEYIYDLHISTQSGLKKMAEFSHSKIFKTREKIISLQKKEFDKVREDLSTKYKIQISHLYFMRAFMIEYFQTLNSNVADDKSNKKKEAIVRLYGDACLLINEIILLLENGYSDGAMARWRHLYELSVYISFLSAHDYIFSEMYLEYDNIENSKSMEVYNKHYHLLGHEPFDIETIKKINNRKNTLIQKYGKQYSRSHGWAYDAFPNKKTAQGKYKPIYFDDFLEVTNKERLKPYYNLACSKVHSGPKGLQYKLGLPEHLKDRILIGPSPEGFNFVAQISIICILEIIASISETIPSYENSYIYYLINVIWQQFKSSIHVDNENEERGD